MNVIPASTFGVTPGMTGATNTAALTKAFASVDDDTTITFRGEVYQIADPVRILRSGVVAQGVVGTVFEYTSSWAGGEVEGGQAWLVGQIGDASVPQIANVTLRLFIMRDLNKTDLPVSGGHQPSSIEVLGCENFLLDTVTFDGSRGNAACTIAGRNRDNFATLTKRVTVQGCHWIGDHQGDGANINGIEHVDFLGNEMPFGGVRRHFYEGGTATKSLTMQRNRVNMNGQGNACVGSLTLLESADLSDNWFLNWGSDGAALAIAPDVDPLGRDVMPVRGLVAQRNVFSSRAGLAAVQILVPDVYDHEYTGNLFDCVLPFYIPAPNNGVVTIRGNTARSDCTRPIAAAAGVTLDTDWPVAA